MEVRRLEKREIPEARRLIWQTFLEFEAPDYSEEGVETFRAFLYSEEGVETFRAFLFDEAATAAMEFFGAFEGDKLQGVLATRDGGRHICCFFVLAACQRRGIGRALWQFVRDGGGSQEITVNSSPFAVPVYRRLGFEDTAGEQLADGIRYTPMRYLKKGGDLCKA